MATQRTATDATSPPAQPCRKKKKPRTKRSLGRRLLLLPFKILLFVLVDGWGLVITSLIQSYSGG